MLTYKFSFITLKIFSIFCEYFIGIMVIYILVGALLITSNVYGILIEKILCEIIGFIMLFGCFLIINDNINLNLLSNGASCQFIFFLFNKFISFNFFSKLSKLVVCFFLSLFFFSIAGFLKNYKLTFFEYLLLLLFSSLGLIFICSANDFITAFLSIELISLCSYFIAAFKKNSSYSLESGIKYFVIGAISSSFFLLGSSFIYSYTGAVSFVDIQFLLSDPGKSILFSNVYFLEPFFFIENFYFFNFLKLLQKDTLLMYKYYKFFVEIGIIFIVFSVFIKLALAPFHVWSVDIYENAPSISTFFFSTFTKLSFFVFLSRFCFIFQIYFSKFWLLLNLIIGFFSIFFGSFGGARQKKIKTLLAYSSISHMGYCLLAFNNFSIFGLEMLYFYLFTYVLSNIVIWCIILGLVKVSKNYTNFLAKNLSDFILLHKTNKFLAFCLSLAFFSLAGIPPLIGFIAKLNIFLILMLQQYYIISLFIILCSVISTFYYIRVIKILYFESFIIGKLFNFNFQNIFIVCFIVFLLVFLFFNPTLLYLFIHKMILLQNPKNSFDLLNNIILNNQTVLAGYNNSSLILKLVWILN